MVTREQAGGIVAAAESGASDLRHSNHIAVADRGGNRTHIAPARITLIDWIWTAPVLLIIALAVALA